MKRIISLVLLKSILFALCAHAAGAGSSRWPAASGLAERTDSITPVDMTSLLANPRFDQNDVTTGWSGSRFETFGEGENAMRFFHTYDTYQTIDSLPTGVYCIGVNAFYLTYKNTLRLAYKDYKTASLATQRARLYASQQENGNIGELEIRSPFDSPMTTPCEGLAEAFVVDDETEQELWIPNDQRAAEYYMHTYGLYGHRLFVASDGSALTIGVRDVEYPTDKFASAMWPDGSHPDNIFEPWSVFDDFTLTYYGDTPASYQLMFDEGRLNFGDGTLGEDLICSDCYRKAYIEAWSSHTVTCKAEAEAAIANVAEAYTSLRLNIVLWNTWNYRVSPFLNPDILSYVEEDASAEDFLQYKNLIAEYLSISATHDLTNDELLEKFNEVKEWFDYYFAIYINGVPDVEKSSDARSDIYDLLGRKAVGDGNPNRGLHIRDGQKYLGRAARNDMRSGH